MTIKTYRLEITARIQKMEREENDPPHYARWNGNEQLSVNHTTDLGDLDFLEMCKILGALQDTVDNIKPKRD